VLRRAIDTSCKRIILSSENLCNCYRKNGLDVHRVLAARFSRVQVIYHIRRQDDWMLSAWQQWGHKTGKSLEEWVERCLRARVPVFLRNSNHFQDIYGASSLTVVPLNRRAFLGSSLLTDFYQRLGLEVPDNATAEEHLNPSVNPYLCEILASVSFVYDSLHDSSVKDLLDRSCPWGQLYRKYNHYMTKECSDRVLDAYEEDNRELHRRFFGDLEYAEIFGRVSDSHDSVRAHECLDGLKDVLSIQLGLLLSLLNKEQPASVSEQGPRVLELTTGPTRFWSNLRHFYDDWPDSDVA
jgi:hypothetical protein